MTTTEAQAYANNRTYRSEEMISVEDALGMVRDAWEAGYAAPHELEPVPEGIFGLVTKTFVETYGCRYEVGVFAPDFKRFQKGDRVEIGTWTQ